MQNQRVAWIDVARGVGIFFVVYGHALSAHSLRYIIYSFHMPLFFFLSGMVFTYRPEETTGRVVTKNVKGLLYPYFLFAVLSFLLWVLTRRPPFPEEIKQFLSIFYGNGNNNLLIFNNILWFLPCLFITRLGFYGVRIVSGRTRNIVALLTIFSLVGYVYSLFLANWKLIFGLETALTAIVFFGAGYLWKTSDKVKKLLTKQLWLTFVCATGICLLFAVLNYQSYGLQIDMRLDRLNNYVYFYFAAFAGIVAVVVLSQLIKQNKVLEYLGKHSLVIFAWHLLLFSYLSLVFRFTGVTFMLSHLPKFVSPLFYSIAAIAIILGVSQLIQRLFHIIFKKEK